MHDESVLRIEGHMAVQGLYEVLSGMAEKAKLVGWCFDAHYETRRQSSNVSDDVSSRSKNASKYTTGDLSFPLLLARSAFLNSTVERLTTKFAGAVQTSKHGLSHDTTTTVSSVQQLELSGWILPCAARDQCIALKRLALRHQHRSFSVRFKVDDHTRDFVKMTAHAETSESCAVAHEISWTTSAAEERIEGDREAPESSELTGTFEFATRPVRTTTHPVR